MIAGEVLKGLVNGGICRQVVDSRRHIAVAVIANQTCQAPGQDFFVASKKMKLLSGNPDGLVFLFGIKSSIKRAADQ